MIIGIAGKVGVGKTTAARHLINCHGFTRHRFAGPLKSMLHCVGLTEDHTDGDLKEIPLAQFGGKTARHMMQTLGTEWGRKLIDPQIWVQAWKATLPEGDVVCDDVRFRNEADMISHLGGVILRIDRPGAPEQDHASEKLAFGADVVILNNRGVDHLKQSMDWLTERYTAKPDKRRWGLPETHIGAV